MNDATTLPRLIALSLLTLFLLLIQKDYSFLKNKKYLSLFSIPVLYFAFGILNKISIQSILIGGYGRNFGVVFLVSIVLLIGISGNYLNSIQKFIDYSLFILLIFSIIYGAIQLFKLDPLPWTTDGLQLTLGNTNFSGALFGMLAVIPLHKFLNSANKKQKYSYIFLFLLSITMGFQTKSLQSQIVLIIVVSAYIFLTANIYPNKILQSIRTVTILLLPFLLLLIGTILFSNLNIFSNLKSRLYSEGSIGPRFDYWKIALRMTFDHPAIGVGVDNFGKFSNLYKMKDQQIRDGVSAYVDKSHSSILDHFANGGLIIGLIWTIAVLWGTYIAFKKIRIQNEAGVQKQLALLFSIWLGYLFQTLISPDQLILATIGYLSLGLILWEKSSAAHKFRKHKFSNFEIFTKIISSTIIFVWAIASFQIVKSDVEAKSILNSPLGDTSIVTNYINGWPSVVPMENILLGVVQIESGCDLSKQIIKKISSLDKRNQQAWFASAICENKAGNFDLAVTNMKMAVSFDPINVNYLASLAKLQIANNQLNAARSTWARIKFYMPTHPEVGIIDNSLKTLGY